jgi:hypothetical protein
MSRKIQEELVSKLVSTGLNVNTAENQLCAPFELN